MLDQIFIKLERFVPARWRWVLGHEGFRRYFANTGWMFAGQIFSLAVAFFVGAFVARYLGVAEYGRLSYAISFAGLFGFIASLGIDGILSRELVRRPAERDNLLGTGFGLKLLGGGLALLAASGAALLFEGSPLNRTLIILFSGSLIFQSINVISTFFQAEVRAKKNIQAQIMATVISSVLKVALIFAHGSLLSLAVVFALDNVWQGIGLIRAYRRSGLKIRAWKCHRDLALKIWKNSWPLMLSIAAFAIYMKIDQVMIGRFMGETAVGLYAAAARISEIWHFIPVVICGSLLPAIVNAKEVSLHLYFSRLANLQVLAVLTAAVLSIVVFLFAKPLVAIIFGQGYLPATEILQIYIWAIIPIFLGTALYQYLLTENMIKLSFGINLAAMLVNIGLNLLFIPRFGLPGAAYATLIAYSVPPIIMLAAFLRHKRKTGRLISVA